MQFLKYRILLAVVASCCLVLASACDDDDDNDETPTCPSGQSYSTATGACVPDSDPNVDADGDGVTAANDCDDNDAAKGAKSADADCDGVLTADDCDDSNAALGAIANDSDCDGTVNTEDECPDDPNYTKAAPTIALQFPATDASSTNGSAVTVRGTAQGSCGYVVASMEAVVNDTTTALTPVEGDSEVFTWSLPVTLVSAMANSIVIRATDEAAHVGEHTLTITQHAKPVASAAFVAAQGLEVDAANNMAYVVDVGSDTAPAQVVQIDLTTNVASVLSASGDGKGTDFNALEGGIALDAAHGRLLVTDDGANTIVAISLVDGTRTVFADVGASQPKIGHPYGIVVDPVGNRVFWVDTTRLGVIAIAMDETTGEAGARTQTSSASPSPATGSGTAFVSPRDLVQVGSDLYVVDNDASIKGVVKVDIDSGARTVVSNATTGTGTDFGTTRGIAFDSSTGLLLVADSSGSEGVIAVDPTTGDRTELSTTNAGTGTAFTNCYDVEVLSATTYLAIDSDMTSLIAIDVATGNRTTLAPPTTLPDIGTGVTLGEPTGLALDAASRKLYIADDSTDSIVALDFSTGARSAIATSTSGLASPRGLGIDLANHRLFAADNSNPDALLGIDIASGAGGVLSDDNSAGIASFASPRGRVTLTPQGSAVLVADTSADAIFSVNLSTGERSYLANTTGDDGDLAGAQSVCLAGDDIALVTGASSTDDTTPDVLLSVSLADGSITPLADRADTGLGSGVTMTNPRGVAYDAANNRALVYDSDLDAVVAIDLTSLERVILSNAETGNGDHLTSASDTTNAIEIDADARVIYTVNDASNQVVIIDLDTGAQLVIAR